MTNPAIQNDFSYYRRTISRNRLNNQQVRRWEAVCVAYMIKCSAQAAWFHFYCSIINV